MVTHAKYSPSKLSYLEKCPSYISSNEPNINSSRGSDIHKKVIDAYLNADVLNDPTLDWALEQVNLIASQFWGMTWTPEKVCKTLIQDVWGYADLVGILNDTACLIELKTGWGERDNADSNIQIQSYALGLLDIVTEVYSYIIEIDKRTVSYYCYTVDDKDMINKRIESIINNIGKYQKHGDYCSYCSNATTCPNLIEALPSIIDSIEKEKEPTEYAKSLSPASLSQVLKHVLPLFDKAEMYVNALKARAMQMIESGVEVPGWAIKETGGNRSWIDESEAIWRLLDIAPISADIYTLKSPAQIEKVLLKAGMKLKECKTLLSDLTKQSVRKQLVENIQKES